MLINRRNYSAFFSHNERERAACRRPVPLGVMRRILRRGAITTTVSLQTYGAYTVYHWLDPRADAARNQSIRDAPNPFINRSLCEPLSCAERLGLALGAVTVAPLKFVGCTASFCAGTAYVTLCQLGASPATSPEGEPLPMARWRRVAMYPSRYLVRVYLFFQGFQWNGIEIVGTPACSLEAPVLICNHSSPVEPPIMLGYTPRGHPPLRAAIAERGNVSNPILAAVVRAAQGIVVSRESKESRARVGIAINARLRATAAQGAEFQRPLRPGEDGDARHARALEQAWSAWPQLLVFPEATTTSDGALIQFATGAFRAGVPVQPCVVVFPNWDGFDMAWSMNGSYLEVVLRMFCRPRGVAVTIHYLPVYYPSPEEQSDARLFASNVRDVMAAEQTKLAAADGARRALVRSKRLTTPLPRRELQRRLRATPPPSGALKVWSDHSYRDVQVATEAVKLGIPDVHKYVVGYEGLRQRFGDSSINVKLIAKHLRAFAVLDRDHSGEISAEDLERGLAAKVANSSEWNPLQWSFATPTVTTTKLDALASSAEATAEASSSTTASVATTAEEPAATSAAHAFGARCVRRSFELMAAAPLAAAGNGKKEAASARGTVSFKQYLEKFALPISISLEGGASSAVAGGGAQVPAPQSRVALLPSHPASEDAIALLFDICDASGQEHIAAKEFNLLLRFVAEADVTLSVALESESSDALLRTFGSVDEEGGAGRIARDGWRRFAAAHPQHIHALSAALLPAAPPAPAKGKIWR